MSKLEEVLNKKAELIKRKFKDAKQTAKKAGLTATIAATTVLGLGTTESCNRSNDSQNEPKIENVAEAISERQKAEQEQAHQEWLEKMLKEIEESGIPVVKKDKQGNVTEVLSSIKVENFDIEHEIECINNQKFSTEHVGISDKKDHKFNSPQYMSVHRDAHTEKYADGSEKHYRAKDYDTVPNGFAISQICHKMYADEFEKKVDAQGDTLYIPKPRMVIEADLSFYYPEKQNTQTNLNVQSLAQNHGGRGE